MLYVGYVKEGLFEDLVVIGGDGKVFVIYVSDVDVSNNDLMYEVVGCIVFMIDV